MIKILVVSLTFILLLTGCSNAKAAEEQAIKNLNHYFETRYSGLTADNFKNRFEKMEKYYSDILKNSDSWLVDPLNYDSTYHNLHENGIETEILYLDIKHEKDDVYNTGIIVKYNTAHSEHSYCTEYRFKVVYKDNEILDVERIAYDVIVIGDDDYTISDGKIVMQ